MSEFQFGQRITCTSTDCKRGLHCFKFHQKKMKPDQKGTCRECGADLIDWERVFKKDLADVEYTIEALKYEMIRHHAWHVTIDDKAINHARRKGMGKMVSAVETRLEKALAPANPSRDGRQTPMHGNAIYYAQHATATCCRTCLEYWHNIPKGRELSTMEKEYCRDLIMAYISFKMPYLTKDGEKIPPAR